MYTVHPFLPMFMWLFDLIHSEVTNVHQFVYLGLSSFNINEIVDVVKLATLVASKFRSSE
jgi:hypothetical protein